MKRKLFYCYSKRLKRALLANGFRIISSNVNPNTKAKYWIFIGSDILNQYKNKIYQNERDKF